MKQYLIESPHKKKECLMALDDLAKNDPKLLDQFSFACMSGEHMGFATVEAQNEEEARMVVPKLIRKKARVFELKKFTVDQIKSFHQHTH